MARLPRIDLADVPQHIIQRGNNRQACFFAAEDYRVYLKSLLLAAQKYECFVHAYVLMTNHVHLLATGTTLGAVSLMMQSLGRRILAQRRWLPRSESNQCRCIDPRFETPRDVAAL